MINFIAAMAATAIIALLGVMHFAYTLHDCIRAPKFFRPGKDEVLTAMKSDVTSIAPQGRGYWLGVLGFNLSHSIGVLFFALLIYIAETQSWVWLQSVVIVAGVVYTTISHFCWFSLPTLFISAATALMVLAFWI